MCCYRLSIVPNKYDFFLDFLLDTLDGLIFVLYFSDLCFRTALKLAEPMGVVSIRYLTL